MREDFSLSIVRCCLKAWSVRILLMHVLHWHSLWGRLQRPVVLICCLHKSYLKMSQLIHFQFVVFHLQILFWVHNYYNRVRMYHQKYAHTFNDLLAYRKTPHLATTENVKGSCVLQTCTMRWLLVANATPPPSPPAPFFKENCFFSKNV